jgi:uncharacterized membrane protein YtjA (UPF0391 family)
LLGFGCLVLIDGAAAGLRRSLFFVFSVEEEMRETEQK